MTTTSVRPQNDRPRSRSKAGLSIGARLLLAQAVVLLAGGVTTWIVAATVGPPLFREHLRRAGVGHQSSEQFHAEQAYRYATVISIAVAVAVAALTALVVTAYFSRRLQRSVAEVSSAATAIADGRYDIRVTPWRLGEDFANLAHAFNQMASRLGSVESTRRQLFSDLAHEIRTPVTVLDAAMEAIEDGVKALDPRTIAMLRDQTRRLVRFSNDFSALARAEEGQRAITSQPTAPAPLVENAAAAVSDRYAAKGVALTCVVADGLPDVLLDAHRVAQIVGNLLNNALRHTPPGGHVALQAGVVRDHLIVTVTDDGDGIPAEHLPHIFERFYRVDTARDRRHGGAGIGLAIAKAFADAHGGRLSALSEGPGRGSVFTLTLPVRGPAPNRQAPH